MKKTVLIVAAAVTLCAGMSWGAHLRAQQPQKQPAPAVTRIAIVNLHTVLKEYKKTKQYDQEVENVIAPMRKQAEEIKKNIAQLTNTLQGQQNKEDLEKAIRQQKDLLKDLESKAGKEVSQMRERQLVLLYKEIEEAVTRVAAAKGFTLVLHYTDPDTKEEKYSPKNIQRKLAGSSQTGAMVPIYFRPEHEISAEVVAHLNDAVNRAQQERP